MARFPMKHLVLIALVFRLVIAMADGSALASDNVSTWDGSFLQSWSEPARWNPAGVPNNGVETYDAVIVQGNVIQDVAGGVVINNLTLSNAFLSGDQPLTISGDPDDSLARSTWAASGNSEIRNTGGVQIGAAATVDLTGNGVKNLGVPGSVDTVSLTVDGIVNQSDLGSLNAIGGGAAIQISETGQWSLQGDADFGSVGPSGSLSNAGLLSKADGLAISRFNRRWSVVNTGTVRVDSGTLEFQGPFEHTGVAEVNAGLLVLEGDVSGDGNFAGTGEVRFDGVYSPGDGVASISFGGDVTLGAGADLAFQIAAIDRFDNLSVAGSLLLGGDLAFEVLSPEEEAAYEPALGDSFVVASATGGITGSFDKVTVPAAAEGFEWDLEIGLTEVSLVYTVAPLTGDYNHDGTVDAADYTVWRDGLGTSFTSNGYNAWLANFGATAPTSPAAVPEPAAGVLSLIAVAAIGFSHRVRRNTLSWR